jgi:hypothetical protein
MSSISITSGQGGTDGTPKYYVVQDGMIVVSGTKDAGAVVTVAIQPGGIPVRARQDPTDHRIWTARLAVAAAGLYTVEASTTFPNTKDVRESINVVNS